MPPDEQEIGGRVNLSKHIGGATQKISIFRGQETSKKAEKGVKTGYL